MNRSLHTEILSAYLEKMTADEIETLADRVIRCQHAYGGNSKSESKQRLENAVRSVIDNMARRTLVKIERLMESATQC
jgi:hypothetical protein